MAAPTSWRPGDLAECIHAGHWHRDGVIENDAGPRYAEVRMVRAVSVAPHPLDGRPAQLLAFDRWDGAFFHAAVFRKVPAPRPDAAHPGAQGWLASRLHRQERTR